MKKSFSRRLAVVGVVVAALIATSVAAFADGVTYNNPITAANEIVVMETAVIGTAQRGDTIHMANPFIDASVYTPLQAALGRGVVVHVAIHMVKWGPRWTARLQSAIEEAHNGSTLTICENGRCAVTMHAKTLVVSYADGDYKTVIASNDFVKSVPGREWNNAYTTSNATIGRTVVRWVEDMRAGVRTRIPRTVSTGNLAYYTFPQPRDTKDDNFFTRTLAAVSCASHTKVDVVTSLWNGMELVAQNLVAMRQRGCRIRVIVSKQRTDLDVLHILQRGHVPTHFSSSPRDGHIVRSHAKIISIDGTYQGRRQLTVFQGSLNMNLWIDRSYADNMVRIVDATRGGVYGSTRRTIDAIWAYGAPVPRWATLSARYLPSKRSLEGVLTPAMGGQNVSLQRLGGGTWRTVSSARTGHLGHTWFNLRNQHRGTYRLRVAGNSLHTSDASSPFEVG
jgi:phospholipase D-like protein